MLQCIITANGYGYRKEVPVIIPPDQKSMLQELLGLFSNDVEKLAKEMKVRPSIIYRGLNGDELSRKTEVKVLHFFLRTKITKT